MADRGFTIRDLLTKKKATLNIPPFTRKCTWGKKKRLNVNEIKQTRNIAKLRIHVERAIQRLKLFKLLSCTIPWHLKPVVNQMVRVGVFLCNLMPKLVRKWREIIMQIQWQLYKYFYWIEFYPKDMQFQIMYIVLCIEMYKFIKHIQRSILTSSFLIKQSLWGFFLYSWIPEFSKVDIPYNIMKQYIHDTIQCLFNVYNVFLAVYMYKLRYTLNVPKFWQYITSLCKYVLSWIL